MKTVDLIRTYLRKRRDCLQRRKDWRLKPLRVSSKDLIDSRCYYQNIVDDLVRKIKEYKSDYTNNSNTIPFENFRILSYNGDMMGKVLEKDGRIFRGIYRESAEWFQTLWQTGLIQVLGQEGYLPVTTLTDYSTDDYPIILEHQIVSISTAKMWNPLMVRDACITICIINEVCKQFGYKLIDGHLNNVSFSMGKPVFTDVGSIVEDKGQYTAYESSLIFTGGYKLIFASFGNSILDRIQLYDEDNNAIWSAPMRYDESTYEYRYFLSKFRRYHRFHSSHTAKRITFRLFELSEVRPEYFSLLFPDSIFESESREELNSADIEAVKSAIESLRFNNAPTITDIGGTYGRLAEKLHTELYAKVLSLSNSVEESVATYQYFKHNDLPINTYVFNYLYGADSNTRRSIRSQIAVAVNVTENLLSYQNWKLESLFNSLSKLSSQYVVLTYHKNKSAKRCTDEAVDQNFDAFESKFQQFFIIEYADTISSDPDSKVYIGRIRGN